MRPRLLCLMQLPPPIHGASIVNGNVAASERLAAEFDRTVLPLRFADSIDDVGRPSLRKVGRALHTGWRLGRELVRRRPDLVYFTLSVVGGAFYRDAGYVALLKLLRVPRVYHLHMKGVASAAGSPVKRALYRWVFDGAHVIHLAPALGRDLEQVVAPDRVQFVANGVPDAAAAAGPPVRTADPPRVLFLSNLIESKGPLVLLAALGRLHAAGVRFTATLAGGDPGDGSVARLEALRRELGLADVVRVSGPVSGAAKDELFRTHDVFAFPTFYPREAFPLVVLEAMMWSLPVVTTREGAIADMVVDGETGALVPQRDPAALAAALEPLLRDAALRRAVGERGRRRFVERFTLERFEAELSASLRRCI